MNRQRWALTLLALLPVAASAAQGYFGARLGPVDAPGSEVISVLPSSPAAAAGFAAGDRLVAVDDVEPQDAQAFADVLRARGAGSSVVIRYYRDGAARSATVSLARNPWEAAEEADPAAGFAVSVREDVAYAAGEAKAHQLDLYLPESDTPRPALLWIHGGGWSSGDKSAQRALAMRFAERGITVAAINHRHSAGRWISDELPETGVRHPAHIEDVADAFAWLHGRALELGTGALFVAGHSSGGHLAALLATDPRYLQARRLNLQAVAGAIPIGGAYDIADYHAALTSGVDSALGQAHIEAVFGNDRAIWADASPTAYVAAASVPMLVVVEGQAGYQRYAQRLIEAASARENFAVLNACDRTHADITLLMSGRHEDYVRDAMMRFVHEHTSELARG